MFDPAPFPPFTFNSHLLIGVLGTLGAVVALLAKKGNALHINAGRLMVVCMLVACVTALLFMLHKFSVPPVVNSVTAICGLVAAYLALKPTSVTVKSLEITSSLLLLITLIWFFSISIPNVLNGTVIIVGPISIGIVGAIFLFGDVHYFLNYEQRNRVRVRRHMIRMVWSTAVLMRAPMFELRDELGLSLPAVIMLPVGGAILLTALFWSKANRMNSEA